MAIEMSVLPVVFPFRLDLTAWALRRRRNNIVDRWDGHRYSRTVAIGERAVEVSVAQPDPTGPPEIYLAPHSENAGDDARRLMRKVLGPGLDLRPFYALVEDDEIIGPLARRFRGVKPPRFPTVFEAAANAIACQQVSLDVGIILLDRLAEKFGLAFAGPPPSFAFPEPEALAGVPVEGIKKLGFSYQKARAIVELAEAIDSGRVDLECSEKMTNGEAVEYLTALRGIGRWSAEYVLLRGLGRLDTFPGDDVGAQNNLRRLFHLGHRPGYEEIKKLTSRWHPYEGLVYFHLLLDKLRQGGVL